MKKDWSDASRWWRWPVIGACWVAMTVMLSLDTETEIALGKWVIHFFRP